MLKYKTEKAHPQNVKHSPMFYVP